jgi:hypothetical protein
MAKWINKGEDDRDPYPGEVVFQCRIPPGHTAESILGRDVEHEPPHLLDTEVVLAALADIGILEMPTLMYWLYEEE